MKKHSICIVTIFFGAMLLSSCLKDDPNTTVFYSHQHIPNINEFMPQRLLQAFGDEYLHYGDNPPRIEGLFLSKQRELYTFDTVAESQWEPSTPVPPSDIYFDILEQHFGIAQLEFTNTYNIIQHNSTQATKAFMKNQVDAFAEDTIAPSYFKDGKHSLDDFGTVYIMGDDPWFTIYYYEIRDTELKPLYAIVLSGRKSAVQVIQQDTISQTADTLIQPILVDCKFGFETMRYCASLPEDFPLYNYPGDLVVYDCDTLRISPTPAP
ncbi:MAG: hypothetical protein IJ622_10885 [Bacteroidales bacterium]|nr:hypothetical protein [Bacteroidales bacterium]